MQSLQDYILENYDVNEGKIWNAIKGWFSDLFSGKSKKKYDRYAKDFTGDQLIGYKEHMSSSYTKSNLKIVKITDKDLLKHVVCPHGTKPSKELSKGFWKFYPVKDSGLDYQNYERFYGFMYDDSTVNDTVALMQTAVYDDIPGMKDLVEIKKLQILDDLGTIIPLPAIIDITKKHIMSGSHAKKGVYMDKKSDPNMYNKLINDCGFEKCTINTRDYAKLVFSK